MTALHLSLGLPHAGSLSGWFASPGYAALDVVDGISRGPALIADFRRDRHAITAVAAAGVASAATDSLGLLQSGSFSDLFAFTRASVAEYLDGDGVALQAAADSPRFDHRNGHRQLLLEAPATNLFLHSHAPATQTIAVTTGGQYTVSCRGTGSLVLSGAGSGSATPAAPLTFTASTGSLLVTVAGSLVRAQVETGAFASSFIQTGATAATRSADSCRLSPVAEALMQRSAATVAIQGQGVYGSGGRFVGIGSGDELFRLNSAQTALLAGNSLVFASVAAPLTAFGLCLGWSAGGRSAAYNGGSVSTDAIVPATGSPVFIGRNQSSAHAQGRFDGMIIWPFRASNSAVQSKAAPAS